MNFMFLRVMDVHRNMSYVSLNKYQRMHTMKDSTPVTHTSLLAFKFHCFTMRFNSLSIMIQQMHFYIIKHSFKKSHIKNT
jgi:hypothetical protein